MSAPVMTLLAVVAAGALLSGLFIVVGMLLARFARVQLLKSAFGFGPKLFTARIGDGELEMRSIPLGSYVTALGQSPTETDEEREAARDKLTAGRMLWYEAPPLRRAFAFSIAFRLVLLGLMIAILGPGRVGTAMLATIPDVVRGVLGPMSTARTLLEEGAAQLSRDGTLVFFALVLTKVFTLGLVGLPHDLVRAAATRVPGNTSVVLPIAGMLAFLVIGVVWIVAWIAWAAA